MIALNSVEIFITCEHLVASMDRETACLCPLTCLRLIASSILAVIFRTSHYKIQDTLSRALRTSIQRIDGDPPRFPATDSHAIGFRA